MVLLLRDIPYVDNAGVAVDGHEASGNISVPSYSGNILVENEKLR